MACCTVVLELRRTPCRHFSAGGIAARTYATRGGGKAAVKAPVDDGHPSLWRRCRERQRDPSNAGERRGEAPQAVLHRGLLHDRLPEDRISPRRAPTARQPTLRF